MIDNFGIRKAVIFGVEKVLEKFSQKPDMVLMDGSLFAPEKYKQETIIKGDEKVPLISAGSIIAKVSRDRVMMNMHKNTPSIVLTSIKATAPKNILKR